MKAGESMSENETPTMNIGALSKATGVPVETIRTWERRYGFPESTRNSSGHRIYEMDSVQYLRLVTAILEEGYRPSQLRGHTVEQLEELLAMSRGGEEEQERGEPGEGVRWKGEGNEERSKSTKEEKWLQGWVEATTELDLDGLMANFHGDFSRLNIIDFLEMRVGPFLVEIGELWAGGEISILHEHFASETLREFLATNWRRLSDVATGRKVVMSTLPGEQHALGLHMAATIAAMAGRKIIFLGANLPLGDLVMLGRGKDVEALAVSISEFSDKQSAISALRMLRREMPAEVDLLVGGRGAPQDLDCGTKVFTSLRDLYEYFEG